MTGAGGARLSRARHCSCDVGGKTRPPGERPDRDRSRDPAAGLRDGRRPADHQRLLLCDQREVEVRFGLLRPRRGGRAAPHRHGRLPARQRDLRKGAKSSAVEIAIIALLVFAMVHVFLSRKRSEPPKWMGKLETATPRFTFTLGFLLFAFFSERHRRLDRHRRPPGRPRRPVLARAHLHAPCSLPGGAAVPGRPGPGRAGEDVHAEDPDWMNTNSWIVSEIVLVFFIVIILSG